MRDTYHHPSWPSAAAVLVGCHPAGSAAEAGSAGQAWPGSAASGRGIRAGQWRHSQSAAGCSTGPRRTHLDLRLKEHEI